MPFSDSFIECSEDLTLRQWDINSKPFKPSIELKVGSNFATNCDILEHLLVTGHRGFNNEGAEVKLWDLRNLDKPVWTYSEHSFTPESVRFVSPSLIASASKDKTVRLIDPTAAETLSVYTHDNAFSSMCVMDEKTLVAADVE